MSPAGARRTYIAYQERSEHADSFGEKTKGDWATQWSAWAKVSPLSAREAALAQQMQAQASLAVRILGPRPIAPGGRFTWQDRGGAVHRANIAALPQDPDADASELLILAVETTN